ncbi:hypothetical protein NQ318_020513 [Aromia moschata]|uniref:Uncharacterized protein n=1 Tax=Aromia moschata TaxID=1265417 RepID=A0AAV8Z0H6_9CUCU|nr:hypothetical protein NQ318_020513 [Aromia moschata]
MSVKLHLTCSTKYNENKFPCTVKDAGVGSICEDDIAMIFCKCNTFLRNVTLFNNCDREYEVSVSMIQCCENSKPNENFCGYMYLMGGYMGVLKSKTCTNVTLIHPNKFLFNRQGVCTVAITYQNENAPQKITTEIEFKTSNCEDMGQCPTPDLDPVDNCDPVDCVAKYSGGKNYYNPKCKECEAVPICTSGSDTSDTKIAYSVALNSCENIQSAINMTDLELLENNQAELIECEQSISNTIICHQGFMDTTGNCVCHRGWVTNIEDEIYDPSLLLYHMCNIETGAWSCINKGRIRTTALLIALFALTIASKILIVMCILNWFYRRMRRKSKPCASKFDPEDDTYILCENISSADLCLCDEPPEKKKKLKTETVNVSFYPCNASAYSSRRPSTASGSSKRPPRSDSIVMSNTTSSSIPVSFESESDATTECSCDEEDYEIEFSLEEEEDNSNVVYYCEEEEGEYGEDGRSKEEEESGAVGEQSEISASAVEGSTKGTEGSKKDSSVSKVKSVSSKSKASERSTK